MCSDATFYIRHQNNRICGRPKTYLASWCFVFHIKRHLSIRVYNLTTSIRVQIVKWSFLHKLGTLREHACNSHGRPFCANCFHSAMIRVSCRALQPITAMAMGIFFNGRDVPIRTPQTAHLKKKAEPRTFWLVMHGGWTGLCPVKACLSRYMYVPPKAYYIYTWLLLNLKNFYGGWHCTYMQEVITIICTSMYIQRHNAIIVCVYFF